MNLYKSGIDDSRRLSNMVSVPARGSGAIAYSLGWSEAEPQEQSTKLFKAREAADSSISGFLF